MKLFNVGCSLSSELRLQSGPDRSFHKPYGPHVADHFNLAFFNKSKTGYSNQIIYNHFMTEVAATKNIKLAIVQWSEWDRITIYPKRERKPFTCAPGRFVGEYNRFFKNNLPEYRVRERKKIFEKFKTEEHNYLIKYLKIYLNEIENFDELINEQMMRMFSVQEICKSLGIELIQFQAPNIFNSHKARPLDNEQMRDIRIKIFDHPIFNKIEEKSFWGWPIFQEFGGNDYLRWIDEIGYDHDKKENRYHIWPNVDLHPNREGHKLFSKVLINFYEKMYL